MKNGEKTMAQKKRVITGLALFCAVFVALLLIATFYDLEISRLLTNGILAPGEYDTNNTFGAFFEIIGDSPVEIMLAFSIDIIFVYALRFCEKAKRAVLMAVSGAFSVAPGYVFCLIVFNRLKPHILYGSDAQLTSGAFLHLTYLFFGVLFAVLGILAVNNFSDASIRALLKFAVATIVFAAVSTIAINLGFKDIFGRLRFRAMNVKPDDPAIGFATFSRWYELKGHSVSDELMMSVFGHTDANKSFPSGHTGAAGISYALIMLNSTLCPKKRSVRALFWFIPVVFTGLVAVSRIVVGAHFMSDVLMGGTFSFVLMMLSREIFIFKGENIKSLFSKNR
ncbi:MAG: phosphatase PAP2 family protein [Eubacterium sp.]|nr:phosphatase PAP2 family protein [Eubacterium sp.]